MPILQVLLAQACLLIKLSIKHKTLVLVKMTFYVKKIFQRILGMNLTLKWQTYWVTVACVLRNCVIFATISRNKNQLVDFSPTRAYRLKVCNDFSRFKVK